MTCCPNCESGYPCRGPELGPNLAGVYDPAKVGAEDAKRCDRRLVAFAVLGGLLGVAASRQARGSSSAAYLGGGALAGIGAAYFVNHAEGSGYCAPDKPAELGNLWQMPAHPPKRADRYRPQPPAPRNIQAWRMPPDVGPTYFIPPDGHPTEEPDEFMPPPGEPAPVPTALSGHWEEYRRHAWLK